MLIFLGTLGLLQSMMLPGLIIQKRKELIPSSSGIIERLLIIFSLSLVSSYLLVFSLAALSVYKRPVLLVVIGLEIIMILWLYRKLLRMSVRNVFDRIGKALQKELQPLGDFLTGHFTDQGNMLEGWIWVVSGCFALSGVLWGMHLCRLNLGTVFSGWDTLFSWNKYAEIWAGGSVPDIGGMYPQLLPANWSVSYVLQGGEAVQFFNTLLPPLFFLMIQLMLFDLGFQRRECGFFFAAVIARFMMKKLMGDQLFDGYMDVPAAAMCLLCFYFLLKSENRDIRDQKAAVILSVLSAAGAAVTKQSGFAALVVVSLAVRILCSDGLKTLSGKQKLLLFGVVLAIVLPWYLHCFLYDTRGEAREVIAQGIVDYNESYDIRHRLRLAVDTLGKYGVCFLVALFGLPFVRKQYRLIFSLMVWPLTVIWAVSYSYDARNLGPVLPFVSMLCGLALAGLGSFVMRVLMRIHADNIRAVVLGAAVLAVIMLLLVRLYPDEKLREDQRVKQRALFGERLNNELLYSVLGDSHDGHDIYTDYPAWFLPGYADCCSSAELTDDFQVRKVLEEDGINWLLLPVVMPNHTDPSKELIERCIADGKCEQVRCSDGYYKSYCLYQVHR